jgi:hypothetical protein
LRKYKTDLAAGVRKFDRAVLARLRFAYDDLSATHQALKQTDFDLIVEKIQFFSPGITVKLVNGDTDEGVAVNSPYNLFVGGNKLGRGVTIKNLLVSYYGRNPKKPQADTVLQHARMYGYRKKDVGLLRLFLPHELQTVFRAINKMELGLRALISRTKAETFRGIYLENGLSATRRNVLAPGSIGVYTAGGNYNPSQVLRDSSVIESTCKIDSLLNNVANKGILELPVEDLKELVLLTKPDYSAAEHIWDEVAVAEALVEFAHMHEHTTGYVYVDRDRELNADRRETQGILSGGEFPSIPSSQLALYLLRTKANSGSNAAWWPQIRFPNGNYAFAFSI